MTDAKRMEVSERRGDAQCHFDCECAAESVLRIPPDPNSEGVLAWGGLLTYIYLSRTIKGGSLFIYIAYYSYMTIKC